jgi:pimeloyl-ACP methyl ester carboxylesterase
MEFTTSDKVKLHFQDDGTGPALVMLNGLWGDTASWEKQVEAFSGRFRCIRLDHRGMAQSEKWRGEYSYDLHARDVIELMTHCRISQAHVLGVCHGGMTAVTCALRYPERVASVIINGTQLIASEKQKQVYRGWMNVMRTGGFRQFYRSMVIPAIFSEGFIFHNRYRLDDIAEAANARVEPDCAMLLVQACHDFGFCAEDIRAVDVPALIMSGDEDCFIAKSVIAEGARLWGNSVYVNFTDCGHFPQRESVEAYNAAVEAFLRRF